MRTQLTAELDDLIATYLIHYEQKIILPSKRFPHVFKLMEAIKDIELES